MQPDDDLWTICTQVYFPKKFKVRSPKTREQYRFAVNGFEQFLGRRATLADLNEDSLVGFIHWLLEVRGVAEVTANDHRSGRLKTLWDWLARRGHVSTFHTIEKIPEPELQPLAWSQEELRRLFAAAQSMPGMVDPFRAAVYWPALLAWYWNSAERYGATFAMQQEHIDWDQGIASLPASIRKGSRKAATYRLWQSTIELMLPLKRPSGAVFPWPFSKASYFLHWNKLLKMAGLPTGRHRKSQSMRVSHATHLTVAGADASKALKHSDPATTRKSYIDQRFIVDEGISLFKPWGNLEPDK